ncbi:MAG TPA: neuraminidase-like domain-containing protein, partial [Anaerolineales bacterium]|nr:neuraminidase-like domain-containing protein [Anaerolineales bacterium]
MSLEASNFETRIKSLTAVLGNAEHQKAVEAALQASEGDIRAALGSLETKLPPRTLEKVEFAHTLAEWSEDNIPVVKAIAKDPAVKNLRDVALSYDADSLVELVDAKAVPETTPGATPAEKKQNFAAALQDKLFAGEPSAVLQHMVETEQVPIADAGVRAGVAAFLTNQPDFNIRTTSIYTALKQPAALKGIAEEHVPQVVEQIKSLQRVQAFTPTARAVPVMLSANLTSAFRVAEMPESTFLKAHSAALGEDLARTIYTNAVNIHIRNEQALIAMREAVRGTGLAILDGDRSLDTRLKSLQRVTDDQDVPLNLESLFGSMDFCECEECTSVYSAAAYFVELLQFLRNNNLDPTKPNTGNTGIKDTPLEKLFRRRPDLGCLELTCENTDTILPYVDLVNEVMESFVVHLDKYKDEPPPKQSELEAFNVTDETSGELLAQPQHTDYEAYCILKSAVYPFTLPYHQPIDATRIFLKYLGTSRYELLDNFRTALDEASNALPAEQRDELAALHKTILDRAADAEYLGLTQEEYIILTKQAFWPLRYFELTKNQTCLEDEYLQKIGVKPVHEYYGYAAETGMLDADESKQMGLTFVKKQFLPRTGIQYIDLVDLLRTQCINPNFPQGKALTILESIQFSYRFLQTLVDTGSTDKKTRFAKLIEFLEQAQKYLPQLEEMLHPDACRQPTPDRQLESKDLRHWVYCDFEKVGKLIVLEAGEGPRLPIEGTLVYYASPDFATAGRLNADGSITNPEGRLIGSVTPEGKTVTTDGKSFVEQFNRTLWIKDDSGQTIGMIDNDELFYSEGRPFTWLPAQDTCDLDKVRLIHLDGTPLEVHEYDSMQRFIRLWRKTGWSIDETDKALAGLAAVSASAGLPVPSVASSHAVDFDAFADDCADPEAEDSEGCADTGTQSTGSCEITPGFLHQLVAVRKLLDLTGLPLTRLLTFWADISVAGKRSLYSSLFLTHNLLSIDKVFQADANGYYLTDSAKLSEHTPVLMTALKLKADDVTALTKFAGLADELTLPNISALYRNSLLAKALHVKVADLPQVTALFGDPFKSATDTLELFEAWGKMEDAGFTFRQLDYLVLDHDDALRPLAPAKRTVLSLGKTLFDGLNAIDRDHPDVPEDRKEQATTELVRAKTALLFDQAVIDQIVGLLEGTTLYTTNAPANQTITLTEALAKRLKYVTADATPPHAALQVTGILTEAEITQAKALSLHPEWSKAVDRIDKQKQNLYKDVLFGIFPDADDQTKNLLAGDVNLPDEQQDPNLPDPNTAPTKRFYFLKYFMPFLRRQLTHRFIVDTASGTAGLAKDVTDVLLSEILVAGAASQPAIDALEAVKTKPAGAAGGWKGYLIPSAEVAYTFVAIGDDQPAALLLNGESLPFKYQQEDPSDVWSTDPTPKLKRGSLYWLEVGDRPVEQLQWKTAASPKAAIPTSALLPDYTSQGTEEVLKKVGKAALLVNGFNLSAEEVSYWQTHAVDFGTFDFNSATFPAWKRLQAYIGLRNSLPKLEATLLDLFKWANKPADAAQLSEKIAAVTLWKKETVDKFLAAEHFDLNNPAAFVNEINLVKIQKALAVADKIGIDIDRLFEWAKPGSKFWDTHKIAEDIRNALRARFDEEQWEQAVKPLSDQLRENQKQALISYLLSQKELIDWEVVDADSLFEFFLIDVQMDPCMQTSRLKQAISSVQLFVQRCLLGLEEKHGVANDALDHERWDWMQRYRVWEANRKVFLYPENWIESNLRDDKSPFFKELEGELLQKDISKQNVEEALKTYLYKVDEVANMEVIGLHIEEGKRLHVFARTRNAPYFFYYRYLDLAEWNWYPWEKMQVDIPSYDVEDSSGKVTGNGCYLTPVVWNGRLLVFFPQFMKKTKPNANAGGKAFSDMAKDTPNSSKPTEYWEIKLAWSEYRNGKWTQKQVSKDAVWDIPAPVSAVPGTTFSSVSEAVHDAKDLAETADHQADTAKGAADTALGKAEDSRKASADATVSVPLDLVNPLRGPIAVINTVNDLHDKAVAAKNAVEDANSKAGDAKKATADAFGKAQDAVTAVENYEKAIAAAPPNPPGDISNYEFVPILSDADHLLGIRVFYDETIKGTFEFNGSHLTSQLTQTYSGNNQKEVNYFQHASSAVYSLQISTEVDKYRFDDSLPTTYTYSGTTPINFHHSDSHRLLGAINTEKLASFFRYYDDNLPPDKNDVFGGYDDDADPQTPNIYHELKRPYSIYNWELFFHTPAMLAQALTKS